MVVFGGMCGVVVVVAECSGCVVYGVVICGGLRVVVYGGGAAVVCGQEREGGRSREREREKDRVPESDPQSENFSPRFCEILE